MILTLDLGTTFFKATLFDDRGEVVALHRVAPPLRHPKPDWCELSVDDFYRSVTDLLGDLRRQNRGGFDGVQAVSFATQTNTVCLLDERDVPMLALVLWLDRRDLDMNAEVEQLAAQPGFRQQTGIPALTGNFVVGRLRKWSRLRKDWRLVGRVCLISDLLTLWLTGEHVTEAGAMGLTGMVDIHRLAWRDGLESWSGLKARAFPRIVRAGTDLGVIRPAAAQELGLPKTCRFVVGCLDQYAGAIGAGNVEPGGLSETTGTVLATVAMTAGFDGSPPARVFQGPSFAEGCYWRMVFGSVSANLLEAYCRAQADKPGYEQLSSEASAAPAGCDGLTLAEDPKPTDVKGMFKGATEAHNRGHRVRAIFEGVAGALRQQVDALCGPQWRGEIRSVGGAARSDLWRQIKADIVGRPIVGTLCPEPTSLGAAVLAMAALRGRSVPEVAREVVKCRPAMLPTK